MIRQRITNQICKESPFEGRLSGKFDFHSSSFWDSKSTAWAFFTDDYFDQPAGEFLIIGMEPIATWKGELIILTVANGGAGLILIGQDGSADAQISVASRFLFARSIKPHLLRSSIRPLGQPGDKAAM